MIPFRLRQLTRALLSGGRRSSSRPRRGFILGLILALAMLAVPAGMALLYGLNDKRSFIVEARTLGAELQLGDPEVGHEGEKARPERGGDAWRLENVTLCTRLPKPVAAMAEQSKALCDPGLYSSDDYDVVEVLWPPGTRIVVSYAPTGHLEIALPDLEDKEKITAAGGVVIGKGSVLLMPVEAWRGVGALPFQARVTIGTDIGPGASRYLLEGRYEARERLLFSGWFGSPRPVTVSEAQLIRGDLVRVAPIDENAEAPRSFGFLSPPRGEDKEKGFEIVAFSALAESEIEIFRYGAEPIHIQPSWHDAALSDPRLLAWATLAAVVLTAVEIISGSRRLASPEPAKSPENRQQRHGRRKRD